MGTFSKVILFFYTCNNARGGSLWNTRPQEAILKPNGEDPSVSVYHQDKEDLETE